MESLHRNLVQVSKDNTEFRLEKQKQTQIAHQMKIKTSMSELFAQISQSDFQNKMEVAASNGYNKCELFSFMRGEYFQEFPLIFLTRGPTNFNGFGLNYFDEMNINPYIKQLQQFFSPFELFYSTNKTGKTSIMISW
mgnify:CR=1 FL=1|tara:strand:- start:5497 stop:5907 length:411 start_codon:yes stop_codon:yes gene_type:complete